MYLQPDLRRCKGKNTQPGNHNTPPHTEIPVYIQTEGIPNHPHLLVVKCSLGTQNPYLSKTIYFVCDLDASYSSILDEAFDAFEATLRLIDIIALEKDIRVI